MNKNKLQTDIRGDRTRDDALRPLRGRLYNDISTKSIPEIFHVFLTKFTSFFVSGKFKMISPFLFLLVLYSVCGSL